MRIAAQHSRVQHKERGRNKLISSLGKRKGSPCQQDGDADSRAGKIMRSLIPNPQLPEDILFCIHSLLPMREAARAAHLSHAFLSSWRRYPNLIFNKDTIGLKKKLYGENFHHKIGRILRNHSGIGLKTFKLDYSGMCGFDGTSYLDSWLQAALKPGIEELTLWLTETIRKYNFPCSLLSGGVGNSLQNLKLQFIALHPTAELGPLRSLTSLHLCHVSRTWDELKCLLSNSLALEQLELVNCVEITCLKIPCALQRLSSLSVLACLDLDVIESKAPNLSSLFISGHSLNFSRVETLQMKKLDFSRSNFIRYARAKLPSLMPNLETLVIDSGCEVVDAPMLPTKFLYLKHLTIRLLLGPTSRSYDYFSLVSFFDASPSLETFVLDVTQLYMVHESIRLDSQLRHIPEQCHACLKNVKITGFSSAKSLIELACYILKNAVFLECLTLDTIYGFRCDEGNKYKSCLPTSHGLRTLSAIRTYIENKVPSTVKLTVLEPCSRCHDKGRW
ncbi:unnamed protein product [Urochloa decumbens]|uniref:At1g61320/AtMIF1 LRR domain-containing protein n=1 Tax=Urochloa decumbens TaxID=240449 RepID=A0ABC9BR81_9POAL